jgi:hypothetical protein
LNLSATKVIAHTRSYGAAVAVILTGLAFTMALALSFFSEAEAVDAARFEGAVRRVLDDLNERSRRYAQELERFTEQVDTAGELSEKEWLIALDRLGPKGKLPAVVELAYVQNPGLMPLERVREMAHRRKLDSAGEPMLPPIKLGDQEVIHQWTWRSTVGAGETAEWLRRPEVKLEWSGVLNGKMASSPRRLLKDDTRAEFPAVTIFFPMFHPDVFAIAEEFPDFRHTYFMDYRFKRNGLGDNQLGDIRAKRNRGERSASRF